MCSAKLLENIVDILTELVQAIVNKSLLTNPFPISLSLARVLPIYKVGFVTVINSSPPVSVLQLSIKLSKGWFSIKFKPFQRNIKFQQLIHSDSEI